MNEKKNDNAKKDTSGKMNVKMSSETGRTQTPVNNAGKKSKTKFGGLMYFIFVVSVSVTAYAVMLMLLLRRVMSCETGTAAMLAALFVILHFLIFRSERQGNDHLFYSWNVNTYFFYIGIIFNGFHDFFSLG